MNVQEAEDRLRDRLLLHGSASWTSADFQSVEKLLDELVRLRVRNLALRQTVELHMPDLERLRDRLIQERDAAIRDLPLYKAECKHLEETNQALHNALDQIVVAYRVDSDQGLFNVIESAIPLVDSIDVE